MSKIVIELQQDALKSNSDIMCLLRKAYLVAKKLNLKEFEEWITNEFNGYEDKEKNQIPKYRLLRGELKAWYPSRHKWVSVILTEENDDLTTHTTIDSIANLLNVYENATNRNKNVIFEFSADLNNFLSKSTRFNTKFALEIGTNQIYNIIENIRMIILDWSITLEMNGILGDELHFNDTEKDIANNTPIINEYINNFYAPVNGTQIQQDTKKSSQIRN